MRLTRSALPLALLLSCLGCGGSSGGTDTATGTGTADASGTGTTTTKGSDSGTTSATDTSATDTGTTGTGATDTGTTVGTSDSPTEPTTGSENGYCGHQCSVDADCQVDGLDLGLTCEHATCTGGDTSTCTTKDECVALFSGWSTPCTADGGECDPGQICVQTGAGDLCAYPPSDFLTCDQLDMVEIELPDLNGVPVTVCAQTRAECGPQSYCILPCESDVHCASAAYPVCDVDTGQCGCGDDSHCAILGQPQFASCNAGTCGCGSDQQCVDGKAGDVCGGNGFCGCSGDAACTGAPNQFDGGVIACVEL